MIKLMICDDHRAFLDGLVAVLKNFPNFLIVEISSSGEACIEYFENGVLPDILLLDVSMPKGLSGYQVAKHIQQHKLPIKVIALSMLSDVEALKAMIRFGAMGFIFKGDSLKNIDETIIKVSEGKEVYPIDFDVDEIKNIKNTSIPWLEKISERELLAIQLIASDIPTKQIANKMHISESVVNKKIAHVFDKTGEKSKLGIIQFFKKVGILD